MEQDYFSTRATVREYTDEEVSDEMLRDVIQKAEIGRASCRERVS